MIDITGRREPRRVLINRAPDDSLVEMSAGNPGAAVALISILQTGNPIQGWIAVAAIDELGLYGENLYKLWNDCCNQDPKQVKRVLDSYLSGHLERETIFEHIEPGHGVPFSDGEILTRTTVDCPWR